MTISKQKHDKQQIQLLLDTVRQQRLDLSASCHDFLQRTAQYDRCWLTFLNMKRYLTIWLILSPNRFLRLIKRGFGVWSTWRMLKKVLQQR
ncbi:YqjK-like family protein [Pantoea sp. Nvir]|uniref:YqjK-like family protein n=1 Tax=Pantoea sp. Nvir TaxID=2576760 RepID=UPI0013597E18|nr:YqjK-like family protein [Pantoea sp. Nvir]MXP66785.1 hypothetical protein [Pantoea sp. Nvir]CAJ0990843.1 hypothetical protein NVIRPANT_00087 [Pantoea sp. Nvir]